ncbi:MAG: hypothetical protein KKF50_05140 [Nanoarchaeota archaeon]|nr:hypothetical protein [Nanoarchaeota archaeon]
MVEKNLGYDWYIWVDEKSGEISPNPYKSKFESKTYELSEDLMEVSW